MNRISKVIFQFYSMSVMAIIFCASTAGLAFAGDLRLQGGGAIPLTPPDPVPLSGDMNLATQITYAHTLSDTIKLGTSLTMTSGYYTGCEGPGTCNIYTFNLSVLPRLEYYFLPQFYVGPQVGYSFSNLPGSSTNESLSGISLGGMTGAILPISTSSSVTASLILEANVLANAYSYLRDAPSLMLTAGVQLGF